MIDERKDSPQRDKLELPDGYYEIVILDITIRKNKNNNGRHLKVAYDICGPEEYKDYFDRDYKSQRTEDPKYNGFMRIPLPYRGEKYKHSEVMKKFERFIRALQESNADYEYDRSLDTMKGLHLGVRIVNESFVCANGHNCKIKVVSDYCNLDTINEIASYDKLPVLFDSDESNESEYKSVLEGRDN